MQAISRQAPVRLPPGQHHALPDARRSGADELARQIRLVEASPIVRALLDSVNASLLVVNRQREVVAFQSPGAGPDLHGARPGEALGCVHGRSAGGCGTTRACERCGALGAILGCQEEDRPVDAECVIATGAGASLELDVRASPIELGGERFTVVALRDVTAAKRREALEQVFFHDVMNTVSGMRGWAERLGRPGADVARAGTRLAVLSRHLEREIRDHRALVLAEEGVLVPEPSRVGVREVVDEVVAVLAEHACARDRTLVAAAEPEEVALETDRVLLSRVLVNMARNALEASLPGETVRIAAAAEAAGARVRFSVANAAVMPPEVQARVFQRSFSTKGRGRGLGTYGMKLIGERYLGGVVSFVSAAGQGTTFAIELPARR